MQDTVVDAIAQYILPSGLVADELQVCFHVGEPLSVGTDWYRRALDKFEAATPCSRSVTYSLQTNGTLISSSWAKIFTDYCIRVSISLDGPELINDRFRTRRNGKGTHQQIVRGIKTLREHDVPFSLLCVLTADSLDYPDVLFEHFASLRPELVSFNVEEIEGVNTVSSVASMVQLQRCKDFFVRFYELSKQAGFPFGVREFDQASGLVAHRLKNREIHNSLVSPLSYVSISHDGHVSTFSPEFLTLQNDRFGDFLIGNILECGLEDLAASPKLAALLGEIELGVKNCERECEYFEFCRGGSPSNKWAELGSLAGTETWWCRTSMQLPLDLAVQRIRSEKRCWA